TPITVIDAFADRPFAGNPAGVCVLGDERPSSWMHAVAKDLNLSETAFLRRRADGDWHLRWFTPADEEKLCGHATHASAHHLFASGLHAGDAPIRFHTLSGVLTATRRGTSIILDFPNESPRAIPVPPGLAEALGATVGAAALNRLDLFAELTDEATVRALAPSMDRLGAFEARGIVVTARADAGRPYDFVSRFFAPRCGIAEDPVTGSAHCGLGPWWSERLGRTTLRGYQASARGGMVGVTVQGDRCLLEGTAVTVWKGELL
ncbi:MAG TPA: PhzF family phenazine biosynthesis protein, partial [Anaeromyxobacteraceae bacterium]|nr:PhzF family phenazine biosynthesis protein [Anaeromyxobacteraceae bacterium]